MSVHLPNATRATVFLAVLLALSACGAPAGLGAAPSVPPATPLGVPEPARPTAPTDLASGNPPPDFAFVFDSSPCGVGRLDTFRGTFTQGPLWNVRRPIRLELSRAELEGIYGTMRAVDVFSYPRTYTIPLPPDGMHGTVTPAPNYYLKVRIDGRTTEVAWLDAITDPNPPRARELRELMRLLESTIAARPEVQTYQEAAAACA